MRTVLLLIIAVSVCLPGEVCAGSFDNHGVAFDNHGVAFDNHGVASVRLRRTFANTGADFLHWRPLNEPGCGGWMVGMRISPHDPKRMLVTGDMLSAGLSTDGGKTFQTTLGFKTYEMGDVTWHPTDPKTVWVGTVSGPYVSHDGGLHWREKRAGMPAILGFGNSAPIEKVLFDPKDAAHLIALGGSSRRWDLHTQDTTALGAVWESRDAGEHWKRLATLTDDGFTHDPNAKPGVNIVSGGFAAGSSQRLYVALDGHGVRVSEDGGQTWEARNDGLPHLNVERVIPHLTNPDIAFAALSNHQKADKTYEPGGVFKTTDGGKHWASISNGLRQNTGTDGNLVARYKGFA
ncbi:MAG: hypothetical protein M3Y28_11020, partial [Armatimonadota bacterium]|nr:hypothetical protein [Armatimonadota bacterium]